MRVEARVEVAWLRSGYRLNATGEPASRLETRERFDWLLGAQRRVALLTAGSTRETFIVGQPRSERRLGQLRVRALPVLYVTSLGAELNRSWPQAAPPVGVDPFAKWASNHDAPPSGAFGETATSEFRKMRRMPFASAIASPEPNSRLGARSCGVSGTQLVPPITTSKRSSWTGFNELDGCSSVRLIER
jgi:hypothetical protein